MASLHLLLLFLIPSAFAARGLAGAGDGKVNPLTPKAAALRYWSQKVPDGQPRPEFLVSKLSPLTVQNMAELRRLADGNALSTKLSAFCSWANLSCLPDVMAGQEKHAGPRLIRQVTDPSKNFHNGRENHPDPPIYGGGRENHPGPFVFYGGGGRENHPDRPFFPTYGGHPGRFHYGGGLENHPDPFNYNYNYGGGDRENHPDPFKYNYGGGRKNAINDNAGAHSGHSLRAVEQRIFFRESELQEGKLVKMPDIKDKIAAHSFLPRSIAGKLPFTSSGLSELLQVFKASENSNFAYTMGETLRMCELEASLGEIKRCVTSAEDMIDFAVDVIGPSATAKSTAGLGGNNATVQMGRIVKINGGRVTKSVSCHQKPFPYMVYSCHSVPSVRVYEVDLLDQPTKAHINRGIAICHVDTSAWTPTHLSFRVLGGEPGKIEVCHWIFENDIAWVRAH